MLLHGSFCFIKSNVGVVDRCRGGASFWKWILPSTIIYIFELFLRFVNSNRKTRIVKMVIHPSNVYEIEIQRFSDMRLI